jgi:chromate transporter
MPLPTSIQLMLSFAKIGTVAYGGGPAMIPLMQAEIVESRGWMTDEQFLDSLAAGYALPGPIATKMALYIGWEAGGPLGALGALVGVVAPSAVMILALLLLFRNFKDHPRVVGMLHGVRPVVVAMLVAMVLTVGRKSLVGWQEALIAGVALAVLLVFEVHPAWLIVAGAGLGAVVYAAG